MDTKYIILIIGLVIILALLLLMFLLKKKKKPTISIEESSEIINALGGITNIQSYEAKVSRINIFVNDIDIVDADKIKAISGCGIILVNNKVQIILKDNVANFNDILTDLEKSGHN